MTNDLQNSVIETIKTVQDVAVGVVTQAADAVKPFVPALPDLGLPQPKEIVDQAYDFTQKLIARQREFTGQVLDAVTV
jgi:hypothetical protein